MRAGVTLSSRAASADCFDTGDNPTDCFCTGPSPGTDCDGDTLPDDSDPCPGIPEGPQGLPGTAVGGFEDLRCWRALEFRLASTPGFFQRSFTGLQPVAVRRIRAEIPVDPVHPGPKPWPVRTGIVVVGVAIGPSIPGHPVDGAATAEEVRAGFRGGSILPNATLAGLQSYELGAPGGTFGTEVLGYGLAVAYARSIHDAAKVSPDPIFLDALGFITGKHILDGAKETVVVGSHGSLRVPNGWAPLQYVGGGGGTPLTDWPSATPLVAVTKVRDTTCESKAMFDHLKEVAKTVPTPDYKKLGVFPVEDPRWNQGTQLSSRPELVSYEAAKTSITSPDAVVRATAFGYRPVSSALRGVLTNGYTSKPLPPKVAILHGPANQYALHGSVWDYEPPSDALLAIIDPDKLCEPDGEKSCSCTPKRAYFSLGAATVKGKTADPHQWSTSEYLGGAKVPEALFAAMHRYAAPGTPAYKKVTDAIAKLLPTKQPRGPLDAPVPVDASFRPPPRQGYLPSVTFSAGPEAAAGLFFQTPFGPDTAWVLATGTSAEVLSRVVADRWVDEAWSANMPGARVSLAIRYAGQGAGTAGWDAKLQQWVQGSMPLAPGSVDFAEYSFAAATYTPSAGFAGGAWPADVVVSEHLSASAFYPGATAWRTNYGNKAEFAGAQREAPASAAVPANAGNTLLTHWAPSTANDVSRTYAGRVDKCGADEYGPNDPAKHWPLVLKNGPFAGLWGHSPPPAGSVGRTPQPTASFAGDYLGTGYDQYLHEGLDINWTFRREYIDPAYRGFLSGTATEYCWGTYLIGIDVVSGLNGKIEVVLPCSEGILGDCTDGQLRSDGGCTPTDRVGNRIKSSCSFQRTQKCSGFWGCVGALAVDLVSCPVGAALAVGRYGVSTLIPLNAFSDELVYWDDLDFRKRNADAAEAEQIGVEMEHRLVAAGKRDGEDLCKATFECGVEQHNGFNSLFFGNAPGGGLAVGVLETKEGPFKINSTWGDHDGITPTQDQPRIFPSSRFPGFASQRGSIYGATVTVASTDGSVPWSQRDALRAGAVSLLPEAVRKRTYAASSFNPPSARETAFRLELVGDMILDCGHPPIHVEIHPFRSGVLHATPPPEDFGTEPRVARYSLFGWTRPIDGGELLDFDLWPPPRPRGATKLEHRFLLPAGGNFSGIACERWPTVAPNRLRCRQSTSQPLLENEEVCADNPRMNPSCAQSLGGGLLEVYWQ